jgi:hypothetical protein
MCRRGTLKSSRIPNPYHPEGEWVISSDALQQYLDCKSAPKCNKLSDVDAAYLSGIFDGEGCFTAFNTQKADKRRGGAKCRTTLYFMQIIVKEEAPIKWIKQITGVGTVFQRKRLKEGWHDLWGWRISCLPACEVVEQMLPYLKIKHRQAEIFLELGARVREMRKWRRGKGIHAPMPTEEWVERTKLINEIHVLNKRTSKLHRTEFGSVK